MLALGLVLSVVTATAHVMAAPETGVAARAVVHAVRARMGTGAHVRIESLWLSDAAAEPAVVQATPEAGARIGPTARFALSLDSGRPAMYAVASLWLTVDHTRAVRPIRRGEIITAADVEPSQEELRDVWLTRLPVTADVIGAQATRDLAEGQVIQSTMIAMAPLVRSGELVSVRVRAAGIEVTGRARASEQGRLGAVIRLVNPDSRRVMKGRVIGPGLVEIVR